MGGWWRTTDCTWYRRCATIVRTGMTAEWQIHGSRPKLQRARWIGIDRPAGAYQLLIGCGSLTCRADGSMSGVNQRGVPERRASCWRIVMINAVQQLPKSRCRARFSDESNKKARTNHHAFSKEKKRCRFLSILCPRGTPVAPWCCLPNIKKQAKKRLHTLACVQTRLWCQGRAGSSSTWRAFWRRWACFRAPSSC